MVVTLVSGQQGQSIHLLDINCMTQTETTCFFFVVGHNVKQSKPGTKQPVIKLEAYSLGERLSVVTLLKENLRRTAPMRGEHSQLFLNDARPLSPVLLDSISRWFKTVMQQAGIDITKFKAAQHSCSFYIWCQTRCSPVGEYLDCCWMEK